MPSRRPPARALCALPLLPGGGGDSKSFPNHLPVFYIPAPDPRHCRRCGVNGFFSLTYLPVCAERTVQRERNEYTA